mmetsp:Transcript_77875/g.220774  ORF Transcript_77875/g.220774 Transcript_77875/m.220774 type:complete len:232 (-) Transcript_77875:114-809(-)
MSAALSLAGAPMAPRASAAAALAPGSGSASSLATLGTSGAAFSLSVLNKDTAAARTLASLSLRASQMAPRCWGTASSNLLKYRIAAILTSLLVSVSFSATCFASSPLSSKAREVMAPRTTAGWLSDRHRATFSTSADAFMLPSATQQLARRLGLGSSSSAATEPMCELAASPSMPRAPTAKVFLLELLLAISFTRESMCCKPAMPICPMASAAASATISSACLVSAATSGP